MDYCDDCAFRYDAVAQGEISTALRTLAGDYVRLLTPDSSAGPDVEHDHRWRAQPVSGVWSALEYACHVRDVLTVQRERVQQVLREDRPAFVPMGREERVARDHYNDQSPETVAMELAAAVASLAAELDALDAAGWRAPASTTGRPARRER